MHHWHHHWHRHVEAGSTSAWDVITALATARASAAAAWAIISTRRALQKERAHQRLVDRHRAAIELLAAFEGIESLRAPEYLDNFGELNESNEQLKLVRARCVALLRASEEPLPISRGMFFRHIPYGSMDPAETAHLQQARMDGNPETEDEVVMKVRGEIVDTIERLRVQMSKT